MYHNSFRLSVTLKREYNHKKGQMQDVFCKELAKNTYILFNLNEFKSFMHHFLTKGKSCDTIYFVVFCAIIL